MACNINMTVSTVDNYAMSAVAQTIDLAMTVATVQAMALSVDTALDMAVTASNDAGLDMDVDMALEVYGGDIDPYTGDYTVTPTQGTQTLQTSGLRMTGNVTIDPIPSNYGLITWNGSYLTVS